MAPATKEVQCVVENLQFSLMTEIGFMFMSLHYIISW